MWLCFTWIESLSVNSATRAQLLGKNVKTWCKSHKSGSIIGSPITRDAVKMPGCFGKHLALSWFLFLLSGSTAAYRFMGTRKKKHPTKNKNACSIYLDNRLSRFGLLFCMCSMWIWCCVKDTQWVAEACFHTSANRKSHVKRNNLFQRFIYSSLMSWI